MDRQPIATVDLSSTATVATAEGLQSHVTSLLRDTSMRVLEAALAIGALATALLLGLGR